MQKVLPEVHHTHKDETRGNADMSCEHVLTRMQVKTSLAKPRTPNLNFVTTNAIIMMCTVLARMRPEVILIFLMSTY